MMPDLQSVKMLPLRKAREMQGHSQRADRRNHDRINGNPVAGIRIPSREIRIPAVG